MRRARTIIPICGSIIGTLMFAIAISITFTLSLYTKSAHNDGSSGEVSLRSYYEHGSGTQGDPFVITRPRHLYNMSHLQALGVYDDRQVYFKLGEQYLNGCNSYGSLPLCYTSDDPDATPIPYLDMGDSNSNFNLNPINAIGSEALPFYGIFDGQNVEIKNLTVYASPEDAGLFGYTAHKSIVKNLFLSNITINALGYTSGYDDLYNPEFEDREDIDNVSFTYDLGDETPTTIFTAKTNISKSSYFYDDEEDPTFVFDEDNENNSKIPTVTISSPAEMEELGYRYKPLVSGDLITLIENNHDDQSDDEVVPNLDRVFEFFGEEKTKLGVKYPLKASSTVSLVVSKVDNDGVKHSKVIMALEYDFTLLSASSKYVLMEVHVGGRHGNNIGLVIGHCDGTAQDCYVYNGTLNMNNGDSMPGVAANTYRKVANGSNVGLIGLIGGTVQNVSAGTGTGRGKEAGVLDFTTVYDDIVNNQSFAAANLTDVGENGTSFKPISTSKYLDYLRYDERYGNANTHYITKKELDDQSHVKPIVAFKGQEVINNDDLGVFTIATDNAAAQATDNLQLENSIVRTEDFSTTNGNDKDYYIYYSTGEFNKQYNSNYATGVSYDSNNASTPTYRNSYNSNNPTRMLLGHHFPNRNSITVDENIPTTIMYRNMQTREQRQNYVVRFKINPTQRNNSNPEGDNNYFYFADLDTNTDGGSFMSKYFNYKMVDKENQHISIGREECGVMLKDYLSMEVDSLSASYALPDLSNSYTHAMTYTIDGQTNYYVSNMINFEIITADYANVTVLAAPTEYGKPAAVGIYRIDGDSGVNKDIDTNDNNKFTQRANDPDYAFFMPDDNHLSYFDYEIDENGKGQIGNYVYNNSEHKYDFNLATYETNATVAKTPGVTEYGHDTGKTRVFAHTFYLPKGRYCIGSASGASDNGQNLGETTAKIFYVCAQGQNAGQVGFNDNIYSGSDFVDRIDFIKQPRFAANGEENIKLLSVDDYMDSDHPEEYNRLANQRLYVSLANTDRSTFSGNHVANISFEYKPNATFEVDDKVKTGYFEVGSNLNASDLRQAILHVAISNYNHNLRNNIQNPKELYIKLFGRDPSKAQSMSYSP